MAANARRPLTLECVTPLMDRKLSDQEIDQLAAFLKTLTSDEKFEKPTLPKCG